MIPSSLLCISSSSRLLHLHSLLFSIHDHSNSREQHWCRSSRKAEGDGQSGSRERWMDVLARSLRLFILEPQLTGWCYLHSRWFFMPLLNLSRSTSPKDPKVCFHTDSIPCHVASEDKLCNAPSCLPIVPFFPPWILSSAFIFLLACVVCLY